MYFVSLGPTGLLVDSIQLRSIVNMVDFAQRCVGYAAIIILTSPEGVPPRGLLIAAGGGLP